MGDAERRFKGFVLVVSNFEASYNVQSVNGYLIVSEQLAMYCVILDMDGLFLHNQVLHKHNRYYTSISPTFTHYCQTYKDKHCTVPLKKMARSGSNRRLLQLSETRDAWVHDGQNCVALN
jgi:hypothetical protein